MYCNLRYINKNYKTCTLSIDDVIRENNWPLIYQKLYKVLWNIQCNIAWKCYVEMGYTTYIIFPRIWTSSSKRFCVNRPQNARYYTSPCINCTQFSTISPGQAYVAISRCPTWNNVHISSLHPNAFITDPEVIEEYERLERLASQPLPML